MVDIESVQRNRTDNCAHGGIVQTINPSSAIVAIMYHQCASNAPIAMMSSTAMRRSMCQFGFQAVRLSIFLSLFVPLILVLSLSAPVNNYSRSFHFRSSASLSLDLPSLHCTFQVSFFCPTNINASVSSRCVLCRKYATLLAEKRVRPPPQSPIGYWAPEFIFADFDHVMLEGKKHVTEYRMGKHTLTICHSQVFRFIEIAH
jgi:hypothetical protein